jgi:hypothetical protein
MGYDMLPFENTRSKADLLRRAHTDRWRIVLDHDPDTPVVHVAADPEHADRFRLDPAAHAANGSAASPAP